MSNLTTLDASYPVERSRLLDLFNFSQYTPDEMLLLDVYLSKINPNDPKTKRVQFRKKEYELFLDKNQQKTSTFKKAALGLFSKFIDPDHPPEDLEFDPKHIWKELSFKKEGNEWVFTMECDAKAVPFFFNTQKWGFIRYLVGYTRNFTSKHSFILYYFFKRKRQEELKFGNSIKPTIAELKRITGTATKKAYKEFKYFKRDVINKAVDEINSFTDIDVSYDVIMTGGKASRIHFTVTEKATPPLFGERVAEPSPELKGMFAEELAGTRRGLPAAEPEKIKMTTEDGREVWIPADVFNNLYDLDAGVDDEAGYIPEEHDEELSEGKPTESEASDLAQPEERDALTEFEKSLFVVIPQEVHKGEVERVRGILNIASKYFSENFFEFYEEGKSYADAMRECADDYNERILDAITSFNVQEYEVRKRGIRNPDAHYAYYKVALEGWLMSHI